MSQPRLSLDGAWTGVYDYANPEQDAVSFTADLTDISGAIWGDTQEPNSFAPIPAKTLHASLSGARSGSEVTFTKEYVGDVPGGEETVFYAGKISADSKRIIGTWRIAFPFELSGPFVMNRVSGVTKTLARKLEAEEHVGAEVPRP